ncbi:OmpA family protein [Vibrio sp. ES.051]|uniref:OmpA family protein n=1 Tax=Vibrio sp. ES.051 TaxID=1761909 RepID=UPI000BF9F421|nr:OmpA family protein [Vibrio sp. ES.051]
MKQWFLIVCGILTGCSSINQDMIPGGNILDTAPRTNTELRHPEWGYASSSRVAASSHVYNSKRDSAKKSQNVTSLERFLTKHNIPHETLRGNHVMIRLKDQVYFQTGSAQLSSLSQSWIRNIGDYLSGVIDVDVVINGHADNTGAATFNDALSEKRAREVEKQLLMTGIPRQRIFSRGFGESVPRCSNTTSKGKACNRRVELTLIVEE